MSRTGGPGLKRPSRWTFTVNVGDWELSDARERHVLETMTFVLVVVKERRFPAVDRYAFGDSTLVVSHEVESPEGTSTFSIAQVANTEKAFFFVEPKEPKAAARKPKAKTHQR